MTTLMIPLIMNREVFYAFSLGVALGAGYLLGRWRRR